MKNDDFPLITGLDSGFGNTLTGFATLFMQFLLFKQPDLQEYRKWKIYYKINTNSGVSLTAVESKPFTEATIFVSIISLFCTL